MTDKMTLELDVKSLCVLAASLGYLNGAMESRSDDEVVELLKLTELDVFYENKNELIAAIRSLNKQCAAQVEEQA